MRGWVLEIAARRTRLRNSTYNAGSKWVVGAWHWGVPETTHTEDVKPPRGLGFRPLGLGLGLMTPTPKPHLRLWGLKFTP